MKFDELFEQRQLVANKIKECIREKGYTKVSFARMANISRPTLDRLLNGSIDNKSTFDRHLQKILHILNLSVDELLFYKKKQKSIAAVCSENSPTNYKMSEKAQKQYGLLMDIIDLCEIYY